jgi:acetyl-CoA C-acetyltransferase
MSREVVIVSAARTPIGSFGGVFASLPAPKLGATAIKEALSRATVDGGDVDQVYMGCVLPAGVGQAPARQASLGAGVPDSVGCVTLNKVCGSGMMAVIQAAQSIKAGDAEIAVAGGMESMSNAPYYLPKARTGYRMGNGEIVDGMVHDGLWDPYGDHHMGIAGELCATERKIDRERQDAWAITSYKRAQASIAEGLFKDEIAPVEVPQRKGDPVVVDTDEEPGRAKLDKIPKLRSAFKKDGTITAANAPSVNDGGAALVVMSKDEADKRGLKPLAKIVAYDNAAQAPEWFTTAPAKAVAKVLDKTGLKADDIDLWEINEAFSVVSLANQDEIGIPDDKINVRGGSVALGHPIGCSGARIVTTLLYALKGAGKTRGMAAICLGGGEGLALMVEML